MSEPTVEKEEEFGDNIVLRCQWDAMPAKNLDPLNSPVNYIGWTWTATDTCNSREECSELIRTIQKCHMDKKGWVDIGYNFIISPDGTIYEGRGWFANTRPYDEKDERIYGSFVTFARIGMDFIEKPLTDIEIASREKMINFGIFAEHINPEYKDLEIFRYY